VLVLVALAIVMFTDNAIVYAFVLAPAALLIGSSLGISERAARRRGVEMMQDRRALFPGHV
jgi:hypothetical protein